MFSGVTHLQARQDLNPQPLVLETSALPIELLAYIGTGANPSPVTLFRGALYVFCNADKTC